MNLGLKWRSRGLGYHLARLDCAGFPSYTKVAFQMPSLSILYVGTEKYQAVGGWAIRPSVIASDWGRPPWKGTMSSQINFGNLSKRSRAEERFVAMPLRILSLRAPLQTPVP
jgi:hypothetical protein